MVKCGELRQRTTRSSRTKAGEHYVKVEQSQESATTPNRTQQFIDLNKVHENAVIADLACCGGSRHREHYALVSYIGVKEMRAAGRLEVKARSIDNPITLFWNSGAFRLE
eukprot:3384128-Heterocapsa_arctica.AAC.1